MGPIDYSSAFGGGNPFQSFAQAFELGSVIQNRELQMQERQQAIQQAQAKAQKDQAMWDEQVEVAANPTLERIAALSVKYPQLSEGFKRSYDMLAPEAKQSKLNATIPIYAAALNGKPETSASLLEQQAEALTNSGREQEASQTLAFAEMFRTQPETAKQTAGLLLSSVMGPDKFVETFGKLGSEQRAADLQPTAMREAGAKAITAEAESLIKTEEAKTAAQMSVAKLNEQLAKSSKEAVAAKFAESRAVQDLKMGEAQIRALAADEQIKRQNVAIAAMNAQTSRAGNDLKRQELGLKVEEMVSKRDDTVRTKIAEANQAKATVDNAINTVEKILKNPAWKDVVGSLEGRMPEASSALDDNESDAIAAINTLGNQSFLSAVAQAGGMSGLTEKEGEKLQNSVASLTRAQSEKSFEGNMREFQRLMLKARANITTKYGVPGGTPDTPDTPAPSAAQLDSLLKKYGGK